MTSHIRGDRDINLFRDMWEKLVLKFRKQLIGLKPSYSLKTPGYKEPTFPVSDDDDSEPATPTPIRPSKGMPVRSSMTPRPNGPNARLNNTTPSSAKKRSAEDVTSRRMKDDPATPAVTRQSFTLETLRAQYERGNISSVPGSVNAKVTDRLIVESLAAWNTTLEQLLKEFETLITSLITQSIDHALKDVQRTKFYRRIKEELDAFIACLMHAEGDRLKYNLSCEQEKAIVTHGDWKTLRNARLRDLQSQRNSQRVKEHFDTIEATPKAKITPADKRAEKAKYAAWLTQDLGMDDWTTEIECLATIMCYYDIAVEGFVNSARRASSTESSVRCVTTSQKLSARASMLVILRSVPSSSPRTLSARNSASSR
jgi:hypothetical protein